MNLKILLRIIARVGTFYTNKREKIRHNLHLQIKKKNATDDDDDDDETNAGGRISFSSARC